jgi:hypothetical protein
MLCVSTTPNLNLLKHRSLELLLSSPHYSPKADPIQLPPVSQAEAVQQLSHQFQSVLSINELPRFPYYITTVIDDSHTFLPNRPELSLASHLVHYWEVFLLA